MGPRLAGRARGFLRATEVSGGAGEPVVGNNDPLVVAVQGIEGLHHEFELVPGPEVDAPSQPQIRGCIVGT